MPAKNYLNTMLDPLLSGSAFFYCFEICTRFGEKFVLYGVLMREVNPFIVSFRVYDFA